MKKPGSGRPQRALKCYLIMVCIALLMSSFSISTALGASGGDNGGPGLLKC